MADLGTAYLGFHLAHPLVPGASPLADSIDEVRRLEDAGAPMITLRSLIVTPLRFRDDARLIDRNELGNPRGSVFAGLQEPPQHALKPSKYCEHIACLRRVLNPNVPIVASLYARRIKDWLTCASLVEQAGADGLELNIYGMAAIPDLGDTSIERRILEVVGAVTSNIQIPVAVKVIPFCNSFEYFLRKLTSAGAHGLVLFNGFHQSDWNVETVHDPFLHAIATPLDPYYRFHWLSRLSGSIGADLAFSGGARNATHAIKAVMCGAHAVQVATALIRHGPKRLQSLVENMNTWLDQHDYQSLQQVRGRVTPQVFDTLGAFEMAYNRNILMGPS